MLRIGSRHFELVRAQSGFALDLSQDPRPHRNHVWRLHVLFVPSETDPEAPGLSHFEFWEIRMHSFDYRVTDWHQLSGFNIGENEGIAMASLANLLDRHRNTDGVEMLYPEEFNVKWRHDYLFHCEFDGRIERDGKDVDVHFEEELPFAAVTVDVPINSADPVATARAMAIRAIGPTEFEDARVTRHDWRLEAKALGPIEKSHHVTLRTRWRAHLT